MNISDSVADDHGERSQFIKQYFEFGEVGSLRPLAVYFAAFAEGENALVIVLDELAFQEPGVL